MFDIDQYGQFTVDSWFTKPVVMTSGVEVMTARDLTVMHLGLPGEVGEMTELYKKVVRDGTPLDREHFKKELGDIAFYWARICMAHGFKPSEVLAANIKKIEGRQNRGTLAGSGDDR